MFFNRATTVVYFLPGFILLFTPSFAIVDEGSNTPIPIGRLYQILLFLTMWEIWHSSKPESHTVMIPFHVSPFTLPSSLSRIKRSYVGEKGQPIYVLPCRRSSEEVRSEIDLHP